MQLFYAVMGIAMEFEGMADSAFVYVPNARLLEALEGNLNHLAEARDPQTVELALELRNAIDRIRDNLRQTGDLKNEPNRPVRLMAVSTQSP